MQKTGAPTLADVAQRAGVNKVTASIALSGGHGNTRVSAATRQRILTAARDLHYQPNALARSLRRRQTNIIGLYMGGFIDTRNLFLSEIVSGLQIGCEQYRRDFLMHGTFRGGSTEDIYAELVNGKVDGLVLHAKTFDPLVHRLAASHLPIVAIVDPLPAIPSVTVDDYAGGRMQAEHLAGKGHRRILYVVCPFPLASTRRRYDAFCQAAIERGLHVITEVGRSDDDVPSPAEEYYLGLRASERPSAVVCWSDHSAYRLIEHVRQNGVRVPEDLAVMGFDGSTSAIPAAYQLTTILAPWREVARTGVSLLSQKEGEFLPEETILPVQFVPGETA
jgi:DNA-binding LacI/PurR family transcriptional regulator